MLTAQDVESNRRSDAWIPKQATSQTLSSIASSAPGAFYPDRSALTAPAAAIREDLSDPVRDLVAHYHGEAEARVKRQVLTADSVTQDARGLRQLIKAGCYRAAVNLTGKLLRMYNQGVGQQQQGGSSLTKHTPSSLQVYRVTHLVDSNLPLLPKQKFRFGLARSGQAFLDTKLFNTSKLQCRG